MIHHKLNTKKVLISPLDWGMGHTTRIIPVIDYFQKKNYKVYIACNNWQQNFLQNEVSNVKYIHLKGYNINLSKSNSQFFKILMQVPKIIYKIFYEHKKLKEFNQQHHFDLIISDNRYGFFHKNIKSYFITHQTYILTGSLIGDKIINKINTLLINKFNLCLIPDYKDSKNNLSGKLSHKNTKIKHKLYIGILSRFKTKCSDEIKNYALAILSGPNTQREKFEQIILEKFSKTNKQLILVRGSNSALNKQVGKNIKIINVANSNELKKLICEAEYIISRSGYSSIMDYEQLNKSNVILVPTPGQTEQEYLAEHLKTKNNYTIMSQKYLEKHF